MKKKATYKRKNIVCDNEGLMLFNQIRNSNEFFEYKNSIEVIKDILKYYIENRK